MQPLGAAAGVHGGHVGVCMAQRHCMTQGPPATVKGVAIRAVCSACLPLITTCPEDMSGETPATAGLYEVKSWA